MANANLRKAAVFVMSLPGPQAAELLGRLTPEQTAAVSGEMPQRRQVNRSEQEAVVREFTIACGALRSRHTPCAVSKADGTRSVPATGAGGTRSVPATSPFQFLHGLDADDLLALLADQLPQTIALILSYLPAQRAAEVIDLLAPSGKRPWWTGSPPWSSPTR